MRTRAVPAVIVGLSAALTVGLVALVRGGSVPLGVPGEWTWLRVPFGPSALDLALAAAGVGIYAGFAGLMARWLAGGGTRRREAVAVAGLAVAAVGVQLAAQSGAPVGYGLAKWVFALHMKGSSGYFLTAKEASRDLPAFLADYPRWVRHQDALHIGTHPPGLIAAEAGLLLGMEGTPWLARWADRQAPDSVARAFRVYGQDARLSTADRATLVLTGLLTLLACSATVVPLYLLARSSLPASGAWSAAALWPLAPSAVLFQPTADTAYPLIASAALALAAWAGRQKGAAGLGLAAGCGVALGVGMQFSLVFLAVGLIVAAVLATAPERDRSARLGLVLATGLGFLAVTLAFWAATRGNPFVTWWWNQKNHARFYVEFPRSYARWVPVNPVELAVGLGLPSSVWALAAIAWPREVPRAGVATVVVLTVLTLGGRNLSEIGRLWLPFMPALATVAGFAMSRTKAGPVALMLTVALLGVQMLALQSLVQVVYPV